MRPFRHVYTREFHDCVDVFNRSVTPLLAGLLLFRSLGTVALRYFILISYLLVMEVFQFVRKMHVSDCDFVLKSQDFHASRPVTAWIQVLNILSFCYDCLLTACSRVMLFMSSLTRKEPRSRLWSMMGSRANFPRIPAYFVGGHTWLLPGPA